MLGQSELWCNEAQHYDIKPHFCVKLETLIHVEHTWFVQLSPLVSSTLKALSTVDHFLVTKAVTLVSPK